MTTFETAADRQRQAAARARLERAWRCTVHDYPPHDRVDWRFTRGDKTVAVGEFKSRFNPMHQYPTVFLSFDKYNDLLARAASCGADVRALFIVQFTDRMAWIDVADVDASNPERKGRPPRAGSTKDIELIIDVPISELAVV